MCPGEPLGTFPFGRSDRMFRKALFRLSLLLVPLFLAQPVQAHPHLLDIRTGTEISYHDMLKDLASVQVVFIGESHDHSDVPGRFPARP